jgi:hypothetical protein
MMIRTFTIFEIAVIDNKLILQDQDDDGSPLDERTKIFTTIHDLAKYLEDYFELSEVEN